MKTNIVEWVDRVRLPADVPLIVCQCPSPTQPVETAWFWVFCENAPNRLQRRWAGVLTRLEIDEFVSRLRERNSIWLEGIDTRHGPPSMRFRLVWTVPPAPCRIYTRRGLAIDVEDAVVTRHLSSRREKVPVRSSSVVEGWISPDWTYAGISLKGHGGEERELVRLKNAGSFMQFLLMYDGIDLMVDTGWLDGVVPRVAEVVGKEWRIVDFTVTPPKLVRQSGPALAPATSNE